MITAFLRFFPTRALVAVVRIYQRIISPILPVVFGPSCGCRFAPTCSHYAIEALQEHGAIRGSSLALIRLLKCTPLHPGGFDPVPSAQRFSCQLVSPPSPSSADPRIA